VPSEAGVNVTDIVHVAPAANVAGEMGQVDVGAKPEEVTMLEIVNVTV
jgi:hypothetical protein